MITSTERHLDFAIGAVVADGIVHEIEQNSSQQHGVSLDLDARLEPFHDGQASGAGQHAGVFGRLGHELAEIKTPRLQRQLPSIEAREQQEIVGDFLQSARLFEQT